MIYYVDIDGTICDGQPYEIAVVMPERVDKINKLYDEGNTVVYWTARGGTTGLDWTDLTYEQLEKWGAKYTDLKMGKPPYDIFICDKAVNTADYFKEGE